MDETAIQLILTRQDDIINRIDKLQSDSISRIEKLQDGFVRLNEIMTNFHTKQSDVDRRFLDFERRVAGCELTHKNCLMQNADVSRANDYFSENITEFFEIVTDYRRKKENQNKVKNEIISKITGYAVTGAVGLISAGIFFYIMKAVK